MANASKKAKEPIFYYEWNEVAAEINQSKLRPKSNPPDGCFKITNIYVNSTGKLVVEYDNGA
jgi:hypothetical protein